MYLRVGLIATIMAADPMKVEEWITESKDLRIFFLGTVGCGKSALINSLLRKEVAEESSVLIPVPKNDDQLQYKGPLKYLEKLTQIRGIKVTIWESKGLHNPTERERSRAVDVITNSEGASSAHLYVYCISIKSRPTNADSESLRSITQALGTGFWKRAVFALTFANELHLPPDGKHKSLEEYTQHRLREWRTYLNESTMCSDNGLIPVIMAGYHNDPLFGDNQWSVKFWHACITRINCLALPAFLAVNPNKIQPDHLARCVAAVDFDSEKKISGLSTMRSKSIAKQLFQQIKDIFSDVVEDKIRTVLDGSPSPVIEVNLSNLRLLKKDELGRHNEVRILEGVMNQWLEIGDLLEINDPLLDSFGEKTLRNPVECCRNVFQEWIRKGGTENYPCTWKGVIQLLQDIRCHSLAEEIKQMHII